jgi:hypothetical protein
MGIKIEQIWQSKHAQKFQRNFDGKEFHGGLVLYIIEWLEHY